MKRKVWISIACGLLVCLSLGIGVVVPLHQDPPEMMTITLTK